MHLLLFSRGVFSDFFLLYGVCNQEFFDTTGLEGTKPFCDHQINYYTPTYFP